MKAMQGSILLLAFLLFAALAAGACSTPNELRSTATTTTAAAARLFSVVGGLEALPLHQHHIALFGRSTYNLTTGLDQPHLLPLPLDFDHPHRHLVVVGATSSYRPGPLNNLLIELFKINNLNNVVEIFNNNNKNNMNKNNNNNNIDMLLHGPALIEEAVVEGLTRHGATRVETPSSPSPSPSPSWRGYTGPVVARLLLVRPFLALARSVDSSLPSWRLPSSLPSWWSSASSQLSSIIASVPSAAAATWAWLPSWRSVVPFVQVALGCLLALLGYALGTQLDPIHKPLPPIRGYPSSSSSFWSSWSSPALLAFAVTSSLPTWPSWPSPPAVSARMWSMLARPATTTATTVWPTAAAASGLRRRRERRLDVGPLDLLLIARSIEACFNATHAPAQPAHDEAPLVNNNTRRRERRIDVGPSDLLLMARSIEACFNAAHAPTQPAHAPAQPAHDGDDDDGEDEVPLVNNNTTTTTRRRERRIAVGPSDLLLLARSIEACFNAAHAPAQPAQPAHDDDHHDGDDNQVPLVNNTRRRRMMAALHHH
ncbi:uncharacterized protein ACA1_209380 [Acanthamoeba castellanii str. Neff]|uniref:Uncharacterized protein n=1 Tax=Acanthamoeba castellanii (strain ATCC 30010 / Neff) TaxID=1257118 RepID=L8H0V0_ACACF|nr:uncharacterized protein ACA1_209380 [Acanthamoeba castellanii str. Neff]ELR17996.1 hypothetical protein ACA1_209380 [Acanthamoeba castellanii str. Neff]